MAEQGSHPPPATQDLSSCPPDTAKHKHAAATPGSTQTPSSCQKPEDKVLTVPGGMELPDQPPAGSYTHPCLSSPRSGALPGVRCIPSLQFHCSAFEGRTRTKAEPLLLPEVSSRGKPAPLLQSLQTEHPWFLLPHSGG